MPIFNVRSVGAGLELCANGGQPRARARAPQAPLCIRRYALTARRVPASKHERRGPYVPNLLLDFIYYWFYYLLVHLFLDSFHSCLLCCVQRSPGASRRSCVRSRTPCRRSARAACAWRASCASGSIRPRAARSSTRPHGTRCTRLPGAPFLQLQILIL